MRHSPSRGVSAGVSDTAPAPLGRPVRSEVRPLDGRGRNSKLCHSRAGSWTTVPSPAATVTSSFLSEHRLVVRDSDRPSSGQESEGELSSSVCCWRACLGPEADLLLHHQPRDQKGPSARDRSARRSLIVPASGGSCDTKPPSRRTPQRTVF